MRKIIKIFAVTAFIIILCSGMSFAMSVREFYALADKHHNINPFGATVQSAHETRNWTSFLWVNANNGAGIKAPRTWISEGRPYIASESTEASNGTYYKKTSYFRKYDSAGQFLLDYARKIRTDYPRCSRNNDNLWGYFAGLYRGRLGKWATDHRYYERLTVKAFKLAPEIYEGDWKVKLLRDYKIAVQRNSLELWQRDIIEKELRMAGIL